MRAFFWSSLLAVLCFSTSAQAQYANKSLGVGLGATGFFSRGEPSDWGVSLALAGSIYIEDGWEVGVQIPLMIYRDAVSGRQHFAMGLNANFRYLFLEEHIRPYLGAQLGGSYIFGRSSEDVSLFGELGPMGGVDFFVSDTVSIGPRVFATAYWALNEPVRFSVGGIVAVHVWF
ncbi:MAG: porin family protein [Proteobacteria bacterium]|nr:porin family protein [Cystobacterineae bacterium]MCL2259616.1 porin family protein [Cystobacterineae bacterium]MCL2313860.1 porin family protein [Pseudomonadota bacterium]